MCLKEKYDDCELTVWKKVYSKAYKGKIIGNIFDISNMEYSKIRDRIVAYSKASYRIDISGETDFNFSSKIGYHRKSKYGIYKELLDTINDDNRKKEAIKLLKYCKEMTHTIENFSLMLCIGSLQTIKGSLDKDRIDLFIYLLDNYYRNRDEVILSHCVAEYESEVKKYLDLFSNKDKPRDSIYKYCEEVYHISNKSLVRDLIKSGKKTINNPDRVIEYMKLAVRFWNCKSAYYQQTNIRTHRILKLVKGL